MNMPEPTPLYPVAAPIDPFEPSDYQPDLLVYPAANPDGRAMLVLPGGGYFGLASDHEGVQVAEFFNTLGVSAVICRYRRGENGYAHPAPLTDAVRAIRWIRANAESLGIEMNRVGVIGFSAGGHLAATLCNHYAYKVGVVGDAVDAQPARPDRAVLVYPVISFDPAITHEGSWENFARQAADDAQRAAWRKQFSNELVVTENTPPTMLVHSSDDSGVPAANSIRYYEALLAAGVDAEMHLYHSGGHGYGMKIHEPTAPNWLPPVEAFLAQM